MTGEVCSINFAIDANDAINVRLYSCGMRVLSRTLKGRNKRALFSLLSMPERTTIGKNDSSNFEFNRNEGLNEKEVSTEIRT